MKPIIAFAVGTALLVAIFVVALFETVLLGRKVLDCGLDQEES